MAIIIKKGTNPSCFKLRNGKYLTLRVGENGGDFLNVVSEADYEMLMADYGEFINERTLSDKNPRGCFIVQHSKAVAVDMNKEVGVIKDNSAPLELPEQPKKSKRKGK